MLTLAVSGLAMATTVSQIETLKRDASELSQSITGLSSASGRSFKSEFDYIIREGKHLYY